MTQAMRDKLFRRAANAEGGVIISAGARVAHVRSAVKAGRAYVVDLTRIPKPKRLSLVSRIKELVKEVSGSAQTQKPSRGSKSSKSK